MMPVKWFFYVPCAINAFLALCMGCAAGQAVGIGDYSRALVLLAVTALFTASAGGCGLVASK